MTGGVDRSPKKKYFKGMPMSEKNESYLFDLLESMNKSLKDIRRNLMLIGFSLGLLALGLVLLSIPG